ncbi:hypothetical protein XENTR_v10005656 [Xenopus tropicalis]|nr:hypothetical protein XENTR_v10016454 [Xenopus tropicalis]KAE8623565.1 hypothetical protein XENTR_v10005656 [Xenopus tropicalis]
MLISARASLKARAHRRLCCNNANLHATTSTSLPIQSGVLKTHDTPHKSDRLQIQATQQNSGRSNVQDSDQRLCLEAVNADHDQNTGVYLDAIYHQQRDLANFNGVMYIDHFRFINLDRIHSFVDAVNAVHSSIQNLLNRTLPDIAPGDFVQLRLEGGNAFDPVYSTKQSSEAFNADTFLNCIANALQSNAECLAGNSLKLVVVVIRNRRGGVKKRLRAIPYSKIISGKKQWLYDFNNYTTNLCLAASLYALMDNDDVGDAVLLERAKQLHRVLDIPEDQLVSFNDIAEFENYLNVNIKILYFSQGRWQFYHTGAASREKILFVLHHENHYYGIKNVKSFIGESYFCERCNSVYHHKNNHGCQQFCKACHRMDCRDEIGIQPRCFNCRVFCRSKDCLELHRQLALDDESICRLKTFCDSCYRYVCNGDEHKCGGLRCSVCGVRVGKFDTHICYMQKCKAQKRCEKYIIYDFECMQETGTHIPNYIYAANLHGSPAWEFEGNDCVQKFVQFFTSGVFDHYTFIAHNAGRYDSYFIVQELIREKLQIQIINQGGKLLCVTLPDLKMRFIDSLNFLPMKLSKLPEAMGFSGSKGYFPHFFNTEQNQNYIGPMPSIKFYGTDYMMPGEKNEFMTWYTEHKDDTFNFQKELKAYCKQDVEVLRKACECYRDRIMAMTKKKRTYYCKRKKRRVVVRRSIDPFQLVTLASVCMAMYRFKFIPLNTIAIVPGDNYHKTQKRFSTPAIQWLLYVAHTENIPIQHALRGGERRVGRYFLDGYAFVDGKHVAFEFQGCFYHGCPVCYNEADSNDVTNSTYGQLYYTFLVKKRYLQECGFIIRLMWEHEWHEMLEKDERLKEFIHKMQFPIPLDPRDALYGGRTNAIKLYHKVEDGENINYYDFTSLYPFVNKTKTYPVGHPKIIYENFGYIKKYFGLAKVKVYPPRDLFFPVLPMKLNKKLMFPLCYTCALNCQAELCTHSDEQRSLTGTWTTMELEVAIEKGYRIAQIYEIWHFDNSSNDLFTQYINLHLRDKQEASGYPNWCTDAAKKKQYIAAFYEKEGIQLRADKIAVNPTKRQISKLFLNSLWGKFGQRSNLPHTSIVTDPDELFKLAFLPYYELSEVNFINDETAAVNWKYSKERYTINKNTNIFIACFTTAYARLELYKLLDRLQERCLYHDTDSVIFVSKEGDWNPPLGDYLGELTSEVPNNTHITEFVSAGPKTYGYRLNTGKTTLKVKGITLNVANTQVINFDSLKDLVLDYPHNTDVKTQKTIGTEQSGIVRNKKRWQIETRTLRKTQKCVYTKRQLSNDFTTLPFGY